MTHTKRGKSRGDMTYTVDEAKHVFVMTNTRRGRACESNDIHSRRACTPNEANHVEVMTHTIDEAKHVKVMTHIVCCNHRMAIKRCSCERTHAHNSLSYDYNTLK